MDKIVGWNVNGVTECHGGISGILEHLQRPSVLCLQETRVTKQRLAGCDVSVAVAEGYDSFYAFSVASKGSSGVSLHVKQNSALSPSRVWTCIAELLTVWPALKFPGETLSSLRSIDSEGRLILSEHTPCRTTAKKLMILNVYCPNWRPARAVFKTRFHALLDTLARFIVKDLGHSLILLGDVSPCPVADL